MIDAVRDYIDKGWHIFPVEPNTKLPAKGPNGIRASYHKATNDREKALHYFTKNPNANIGLNLEASGLVCVDVDSYKDDCEFAVFMTGKEMPPTLTQRSASGGHHYIFKAADADEFVGQLCKGVDIKHKGYVLLEPSVFDGKCYTWETDDEPAPVPSWVPRKNAAPLLEAKQAPVASNVIDLGRSISGFEYNQTLANIQAGENWHTNTRDMVAHLIAKGWTADAIYAIAEKDFNLDGPTSSGNRRRELQTFVNSALEKGFNPPTQQNFAPVPVEENDNWPTLFTEFDANALPIRRWIYGNHYIRGFISVLASAGGVGKTSLQIVEALSIVTGKPLLGEEVKEQCNVWIINLEDPRDEMHRRVIAAMQHHKITKEEVAGRLFVDADRDFPFKIAVQSKNGLLVHDELIEYMKYKIKKHNIGIVMIDPFVSSHNVQENDNMAINAVVDQIRAIADHTECAIGLVHHIRKMNGQEADVDSIRGAGSLIGAARAARVINKIPPEEAEKLGVSDQEAIGIFRVDDGKSNLTPPAANAVYRRMASTELSNGDHVGVTTAFSMPDLFDGLTGDHVMTAQRLIAAAEERDEPMRKSAQATHWAGNAVAEALGINPEIPAQKARASAVLKMWIKTNLLKEESLYSKRDGREVPCIIVGEWMNRSDYK